MSFNCVVRIANSLLITTITSNKLTLPTFHKTSKTTKCLCTNKYRNVLQQLAYKYRSHHHSSND